MKVCSLYYWVSYILYNDTFHSQLYHQRNVMFYNETLSKIYVIMDHILCYITDLYNGSFNLLYIG